MKKLKYFLKKAQKEKWAIGQFNFCALEQLRGIIQAAQELKAPIILGTSQGEIEFFGIQEAVLLRDIYRKKIFPYIYLNLDHGRDINLIKEAIDFGYDCVHFDGSGLSLKENIKLTKEIVKYAHKKGVLVEGEMESIKGSSEIHPKIGQSKKYRFTNPKTALQFIKETNIDSLAVNIGNLHGVYKRPIKLDIQRLKEIKQLISLPLVLHGGSGTDKNNVKQAIRSGIVKININTEIRIVWKSSLYESLKNKKSVKPYKILPEVVEKIKEKTKEKISLFRE
jgi:ketose-bisphosphate aldolase